MPLMVGCAPLVEGLMPLMVGGGASRGLEWLVGGGGAPLVVWSFKYFTPIIAMWALFYPKKT